MTKETFSRKAAERAKKQLITVETQADYLKLQWAQAVLKGEEAKALYFWKKYREVCLSEDGPKNFTQAFAELVDKAKDQIPSEEWAAKVEAIEHLDRSGVAKHSLQVGDKAPDFTLPTPWGKPVALSRLLERGPVLLSFYRGDWCPFCNLELQSLLDAYPRLEELGVTIVSLSPQTIDKSMVTAQKIDMKFMVLSDEGNRVARMFGITFRLPEKLRQLFVGPGVDFGEYYGDRGFELPLPATFVIDSNGTIRMAFAEANFTRRIDPSLVIVFLEELAVRQ
jgi:peroxiredoxin